MNLFLFMIGLTFMMVAGFVSAFLWAASSGQFEDLTTPAYRILSDESDELEKNSHKNHTEL
ncbi:MAG: cbb3-type cytochrome oxidase assembly protein CcoS [Bdellovibrionales bacterium]|nr:cbb3-type cytochrome oxidase assembly protein CcoS [Bdellovibrionales bacterium]